MRELEKLKFLNENLLLAQKKKDEILAVALDDNRKLREELESLKNLLKSRNLQIEEMKKNARYDQTKSEAKLKTQRKAKPAVPRAPQPPRGPKESVKKGLPVIITKPVRMRSSNDLSNLVALKSISDASYT